MIMKEQVTYWPCAPDGFIPNSIVRENYNVKDTIIIREEQWKPPEWKPEWGDFRKNSESTEEGMNWRFSFLYLFIYV